jgi:hypothetical protein
VRAFAASCAPPWRRTASKGCGAAAPPSFRSRKALA